MSNISNEIFFLYLARESGKAIRMDFSWCRGGYGAKIIPDEDNPYGWQVIFDRSYREACKRGEITMPMNEVEHVIDPIPDFALAQEIKVYYSKKKGNLAKAYNLKRYELEHQHARDILLLASEEEAAKNLFEDKAKAAGL